MGRAPAALGFAAAALLLSPACGSPDPRPDSAAPTSVVAATSSTTTTTPKLTREQLIDRARQSVVRVRNTGCGELSTGSAWLSGDGRMVSNRHVVEGLRYLEMSTWDGRDLTVSDAHVATGADISRIAGDWSAAPGLVAMGYRTSRVEPGERIAILGYPEGNELAVSTGVAVGYDFDPDLAPREILKLTTVVKPGNSGGPAVDELGRVVGVVYAKELATSESLVIPIADVIGDDAAPLEPAPACDQSP